MYLNCHTHYSLRYGTISEEELLDLAAQYGLRELILTDINNTTVVLNAMRLGQQRGIRVIPGIDFRQGIKQMYIGIPLNNRGYQQLNHFLSSHLHQDIDLPKQAPEILDVIFVYPFERVSEENLELRKNEMIGVRINHLHKLTLSPYVTQKEKLVALESMTFRHKRDHNVHRLLRAIDNNALLSMLTTEQHAPDSDLYISPSLMTEHYEHHHYLLDNANMLVSRCQVEFDFSDSRPHQNKLTYTGDRKKDEQLIEELCIRGLAYRYDEVTSEIRERMYKELNTIKKMDYVPFFLINWDIVSYAQSQGYFHVGRGSGANSIVAYLLGITDVDPTELDLYFERFMNLYRSSPPDFDIDFSWRDREDITRYIFDRFGENGQVALLATYNTFKYNAAVRELGKVFGLPKEEIDKLAAGKFDFARLDRLNQLVIQYAQEIDGMPNYLSIHAGGIIISERPLHYFTSTFLPPKGFPTVQIDMVISEDVGLYKYDILAQRGLGKIKDAVALIEAGRPDASKIDIHNPTPFFTDPEVVSMISEARCTGCFYVESPAMRMLLRKLEVKTYLGLVAASSIIRPGVAKSGMMREYILRHKDPSRAQDAHPVMRDIMPDTYGIMVYQEDVIKVAHHFAGLTLGEADVLRRGMSGKYRSREEFQLVRDKFHSNCANRGYDPKIVAEVWHQIESFAGYAFAKGHSASYAVESYQCLYLKAHYPLEYLVAVINNGGGFYRVETYIHEMRQYGGIIHAPCINTSDIETTVSGRDIYLGLGLLHSLDSRVMRQIVSDRDRAGPYESLSDFMHRLSLGMEQLDILIRIGAFRSTAQSKQELLWRARYYHQGLSTQDGQGDLFDPPRFKFQMPSLDYDPLTDAYDEMELLGFPLCSSYDLIDEDISTSAVMTADLHAHLGHIVTQYGYLVSIKNTKTSAGRRMQFGTFLDQHGDWIDTVHFPPVAARYSFKGKGVYEIRGRVVEEFDYYTIEVESMRKLAYRLREE